MYKIDPEIENAEILKRYRSLLRVWNAPKTAADKKQVSKAFKLAVDAHKDMRRKSGEPYIYHPIEVARIVAEDIGLGRTSIICALLHDVVEDTEHSIQDIRNMFGDKVARIIDGLTKIDEILDQDVTSMQAENFKKILLTMSDDVRVILIKLADRLHNMRTLDSMKSEKQLKIASETAFMYAPLAHRLGLYTIKSELEDLSLKYTEPEVYNTIAEKLSTVKDNKRKFHTKFLNPIKKDLKEQGIKFKVITPDRSISSIWEKMQNREVPFEELSDTFIIRIIIDTLPENEKIDCWKVYSTVTDHYRPNLEKLRDWISIPKINGYEALHTTVMSQSGKWVEVQIRTKRMDEIAEKGYAAHWKYKGNDDAESGLDEWLKRIRELLKGDESNALLFVSDFKMNLFSDEIFVFTPKGDLIKLPFGSTALDFAYHIHTQVGNSSIGAKVNHKLVPLSYKLRSGDQVEVITSKIQYPKNSWLDFVVTARAKHRIKTTIRDYRKTFKEEGKSKLEAYFKQLNVEFTRHNVSELQETISYPSSIDMYYHVARGKVDLKKVKDAFQNDERGSWLRKITNPFSRSRNKNNKRLEEDLNELIRKKPETVVLEENVENIDYVISECCNPIPGDDVIGIISNDQRIRIHRTKCEEAIQKMSQFGDRIVKTKWREKESISFLTGIKIVGIDSLGLINKITSIISNDLKLNIRSFHLETVEGVTEALIMLYVYDTDNLNALIDRLKEIKNIKKVTRINRITMPVYQE